MKHEACTAIRRRRCALLMPGGLSVTARVEGDAFSVLHIVGHRLGVLVMTTPLPDSPTVRFQRYLSLRL